MIEENATSPWRGPASPDEPDPRPWPRRLLARLRKGPAERSRITLNGYLLIAVTIALGGAAFNSGNNLLFFALAFLLACLILNGLLSWANFGGLSWRLRGPRRIIAGRKATLQIELRNHRRWLPSAALQAEVVLSSSSEHLFLHLDHAVPPGGGAVLSLELPPQKRGRVVVRLHRLASSFPFGFIRKGMVGDVELEVIVRPAPVFYQTSPLPSVDPEGGAKPSRRPGSQGDLIGLRRYREGDSPRAIHWKASARARRLLIRELAQDHAPRLALRLSLSRRQWADAVAFERMLSLATGLCERWSAEGVLAGVSCDGSHFRFRRPGDVEDFLDFLALAEGHAEAPVAGPALRSAAIVHLRPLPRGAVGAFLHDQAVALALR